MHIVEPFLQYTRAYVVASKDDLIEMSTLKLEGPSSQQSYLTHQKPRTLVVAVSAKMSYDHYHILKQVLEYIKSTPNCTKQDAVRKRNELVGR